MDFLSREVVAWRRTQPLASAQLADVREAGRRLFEGSPAQAMVVAFQTGGLGVREREGAGGSARQGSSTPKRAAGLALPSRRASWTSRDRVAYARALLASLFYYTLPRVGELWREYRARSERVPAGERPVARPRLLLAELRTLGSSGRFYPLGDEILPDGEVLEEARSIYRRYFSPGEEAAAAFERFLARATDFNPLRRSSNLRKTVRDVMLEASMLPRGRLARFFDARLTKRQKAARAAYAAQGLAEDLAAFRRAVHLTVLEEGPGPGRVLGVVLSGSYASGAAGPQSDFDYEVVTQNGSPSRAAAFAERLRTRWTSMGRSQAVTLHTGYALLPSAGLLGRIHREATEAISPYPDIVEKLKRDGPAAVPAQGRRAWWSPAALALYRTVVMAVTLVSDLKTILFGGTAGESEPSIRRVLAGLYTVRVISIAFFILTSIAMPVLVKDIVGPEAFAGHFGLLNGISAAAMIVAGFLNGTLVDRLGARRAMVLGAWGRAIASLMVPILGWAGLLSYWTLVLLAVANGVLMSITLLGESSILPGLLKDRPERLQSVNAVMELTFSVTATFGAFFGGAIVQAVGPLTSFLWYGLIHIVMVVPLYHAFLPGKTSAEPSPRGQRTLWRALIKDHFAELFESQAILEEKNIPSKWGSLFKEMGAGLAKAVRIVLADPVFAKILAFTGAFALLWVPLRSTALPVINGALGGDAVTLGHLLASLYLGMTAGNLISLFKAKALGRARLLRASTLGFLAFLLALIPGGQLPVLAAVALLHFFTAFANVLLRTMFQERARERHPDDVGKLMGLNGGVYNLSATLGNFMMGLAFSSLVFPRAMGAMAAAFVLAALLFWVAPKVLLPRSEGPGESRRKD